MRGQNGYGFSRVMAPHTGRVRRFLKPDGSGQIGSRGLKSHGSGRVGSNVFFGSGGF